MEGWAIFPEAATIYGNNINHKPVETSLNRFKPVLGVTIGYSQFKKCYCERTGDCSSCTQRTIDDSVAAAMSTCGGGTRQSSDVRIVNVFGNVFSLR